MKMESQPYGSAVVDYARRNPNFFGLTGDVMTSCELDGFAAAFPDRFLNVGMAEQNMMGVAGGLARTGLLPAVHTFGVFVTRRPYDQVAMAIGYPRLRVRLMGFLPGLTTPAGPTHQAIDDVALMRAIPGMVIVDPGDAAEISQLHDVLDEVDGPSYARVMRGGARWGGEVPQLFDSPMVFGRARELRRGDDLCVISSGATTAEAMSAAETLEDFGVSLTHVHVSTLKPLDVPAVADALARSGAAITVENHLVNGGLGSAVAEVIAEHRIDTKLARLGLQDTYARGGSRPYLFNTFGFSARHVIRAAQKLLDLDPVVVAPALAHEVGGARSAGDGGTDAEAL